MKKITLWCSCLLLAQLLNGQDVLPTFEDIEETYIQEVDDQLSTLMEELGICDPSMGAVGSKFKWGGTQAGDIQNASDADLYIRYDAGGGARESMVTLKHISGGFQRDFVEAIEEKVGSPSVNPNDPASILEMITKEVTNVQNRQIEEELYVHWICEMPDNCHWEKDATAGVNHGGVRNCQRASQEPGYSFRMCEGRWGVFRVDIYIRRRKSISCKKKMSFEHYCFLFAVRPDLPPGVIHDPAIAESAFVCETEDLAVLRMDDSEEVDSDGVCWSSLKILGEQPADEVCGEAYTKYVPANAGDLYQAQYYKNYTNGCTDKKIKGLAKKFVVVPLAQHEVPNPEASVQAGCEEVCDLVYDRFTDPLNASINRQVLWYTTRSDQSEQPFHQGKTLPGCWDETTTFFVALQDELGDCDPQLSGREPVTALVLNDVLELSEQNDAPIAYRETHLIYDNRGATPQVDCTTDNNYHVQLDEIDDELIQQVLDQSNEAQELSQNGYVMQVNGTAKIQWFRTEDDGSLTPHTAENPIYKQVNGQKLVCAENTGIATGDYNTLRSYVGKIKVKVAVYDNEGNLEASPNCEVEGSIVRDIGLRRQTAAHCKDMVALLQEDESIWTDCQSREVVIDCAASGEDPEIGLPVEEVKDLFNSTNQFFGDLPAGYLLTHTWNPTEGLAFPEETRTPVIYEDIPVQENNYQMYVLTITATEDVNNPPIFTKQFQSANHCALVYKCPSCEEYTVNEGPGKLSLGN